MTITSQRRVLSLQMGFTLLLAPSVLSLIPSGGAAEAAVTVPTCPSTTVTRTGNQTTALNQVNNGGTWNLSGAVWDKFPGDYPVRSDAWTKGCLVGSKVIGRVPRTYTRDQYYNGIGATAIKGEAYRQTLTAGDTNFLVYKDTYASDFEDGFDPNSPRNSQQTVYMDHTRTEWIRDDCIETEGGGTAEGPMNVVLKNSLWDGCFTVFGERPSYAGGAVKNGAGAESLTVEDSLIYSNPQPLGTQYCNSTKVTQGRCKATSDPNVWLGSQGIWKWSIAAASKVVIRNTIFRLDMASYSSCAPQVWPDGTYQNVTLVWTGSQPYARAGGCTNVLPPGVTLTTDVGVWDRAKAAWN